MIVYNSLTFKMEEFKSINPNEVLMYVCGPTVYDSPHLGHAKSAVTFDIIRRYLEFKGYNVKLVKNYTDIDDKIIKRANQTGIDYKSLSEIYIEEYEDIMEVLNIKSNYQTPKATEIIDFMIEVIENLIERGNAYESSGSVYFAVSTYKGYDTLFQNINQDENETYGIPLNENPLFGDKYNEKDFVLWKKWKKGEPYWESPWGRGRPGWHIECSSMAIKLLGNVIDIHGGGLDLKSPHHKNEIAQSTAYTGEKQFANYFLHNGFVNVNDEKMSKSLGNFFLVSDILKKYSPMVIRFFLISSHYRHSINYTSENIKQAKRNYNKIISTIQRIYEQKVVDTDSEHIKNLIFEIKNSKNKILKAMDNDFNTPIAIATILTLIRKINQYILEKNLDITKEFKERFFTLIKELDEIFGIFPKLELNLKKIMFEQSDEKDEVINNLLDIIRDTRDELRRIKLYALSDTIRDKLIKLGIKIEDK